MGYLEVSAIGREDGVGQVIACAYRSLCSCELASGTNTVAKLTMVRVGGLCVGIRLAVCAQYVTISGEPSKVVLICSAGVVAGSCTYAELNCVLG